jgi:hypothetical protein
MDLAHICTPILTHDVKRLAHNFMALDILSKNCGDSAFILSKLRVEE